jgi:sRNA-binding protein
METQIERIMRGLKCSEAEAMEIAKADKEIDRGAKMSFDLSAEAEKEAKKYAKTGTRTTNGAKTERKRKENPTKATVITEIFKFLNENAEISAENVVILNKERQISFKIGDNSFELTLTQKRKPKN